MKKATAFAAGLILAVTTTLVPAVMSADGPDPIAGISTFSEAQLASMEKARRNTRSTGNFYISEEIAERSLDYIKLLNSQGVKAVSDQLFKTYATDDASRDFAAAALALRLYSGYGNKISTSDGGLGRKMSREAEKSAIKKEIKKGGRTRKITVGDEKKLVKNTIALVDDLSKKGGPHAESAAVEMLLQVFCESLPGQHAYIDNGKRDHPDMPEEIAARAADFLSSKDPFVRAMAEWTISIKISSENDREKRGMPWPGSNPAAWFTKWMAVPESEYLAMDYMRQAISLGAHRRAADLHKLAADVMRRAEEKAQWAGGNASAVGKMRGEFAKLAKDGNLSVARGAWVSWRETARPVVLETKDIDFKEIVYLKRFSGGHHIQPDIHMNKYPSGGDIYVQDGLNPTSPAKALIKDQIKNPGYVQDIDLWFDADRIVFSRSDGDNGPQWLYEIGVDGRNLKQLTDSKHHDVDPAWLPDGGVVFGSTRSLAGIQCGGGGYAQNNIFRLQPDLKTVLRISYSADDDAYPYVLNDGKIVFMRWDYQERGVDEIFSLWAVRPDGSASDGFYRVHIPDNLIIQALKDPVPIPGTQKLVAMGSSHRAGNEGMVALCDLTAGINNPEGIRSVTPYHSAIGLGIGSEMKPVEEGGVPYVGGYYVKPYPITEKTFLVSAGYDMPQSCNFQAYYIDVWGNKELLERDKLMEVISVLPLRKREKPPVIPSGRDESKTYATVYVENVYNDLPGVKKGEVKYIRLLEQGFWINHGRGQGSPYLFQGSFTTSGGTGQGPTRIIGIVPVEEDGSASFRVPADMPVYFQALDKDFRGIQRMRTHVEFMRGEFRGCIGCHETREYTVKLRNKGMALDKKPVMPDPPPWGANSYISYQDMIQPVFEKKCVKCHSGAKPKGGIDLTAKKDKKGYMESYRSLFGVPKGEPIPKSIRKSLNPTWDAMTKKVAFFLNETSGEVTKPYQFGSPQAPVATKLVKDPEHRKLLTDDEMRLIMAWLDVRAPYTDSYYRGKQTLKITPPDPFGDSREWKVTK